MRNFVIKWAINAIGLLIISQLIKGIEADGVSSILVAAVILGILNAFIRPFLLLLTIPINILSLGLFTLFINAFMLKIVDWLVIGFSVSGIFNTLFAALLLSVISIILSAIFSKPLRD